MKKVSTLRLLLFLVLCLSSRSAIGSPSDASSDDDQLALGEDGIVEQNPDYVGPSSPSTDEEEDQESEEMEEEGKDAKSAISKALHYPSTVPRRTMRFIKKHRFKITLVLIVIAFRHEILRGILRAISKPVRNPETGEVTIRLKYPSPTSILKIILFIDLMRRLQSSGNSSRASPLAALLLTASGGNPSLALFLSKLMAPSSPAYIPPIEQHFTFERINERYKKDGMALRKAVGENKADVSLTLSRNATRLAQLLHVAEGSKQAEGSHNNGTVIMMDWTKLDTTLSQGNVLRDQVSFLLSEYGIHALTETTRARSSNESGATEQVEVVLLLESPGGSAADYALAAQHILRLRREGIKVTICVDKVAASGGYMLACTSSPGCLYAAPFAVLGSIGVVGQSLNIHKTLEGWGIQPLVFRGGKNKAPVGWIGEVTQEGIDKVQSMIDDTHRAFKRHVADCRPMVAQQIENIATGDIWLGYDALEKGLIDRIITSDEYIGERIANGARVLKLVQLVRSKNPFSRPTTSTVASLSNTGQGTDTGSLASLLPFLADFRLLLKRVTDALDGFTGDRFPALVASRVTGVTDMAHPTSHK